MINKIKLLTCALAIFLLTGCTATEESAVQIFAMDTIMDLKAYGKNGSKALSLAEEEIRDLDALFSPLNEKSEVYAINQNAGVKPVTISPDTADILTRAKEINSETNNAFALTIYPIVDAWGFMKEEKQVPDTPTLTRLLPLVNDSKLMLNQKTKSAELLVPKMAIDLGGIAKGYLSDRVSAIMREQGVTSAIISLGGNVATIGTKEDETPWKVALQDPKSESDYIGIFSVSDLSVITSGGYQRHFEENGKIYHHILDPKTGYPAQNGLLSVTIISKDGTKADGLSTALFVMGLDTAVEFWQKSDDFEAVFITEDMRVLATEGIEKMFSFESAEQGYKYEVIKRH